jgi:hypothetical protein
MNTDTFASVDYEYGVCPDFARRGLAQQSEDVRVRWADIPTEIYLEISRYLSIEDARILRLVSREFSTALIGAVFGSVVVPFGRSMYGPHPPQNEQSDPSPLSASMFEKYGCAIRKFGISFEASSGKESTSTLPHLCSHRMRVLMESRCNGEGRTQMRL